jgi:hypothetical protein
MYLRLDYYCIVYATTMLPVRVACRPLQGADGTWKSFDTALIYGCRRVWQTLEVEPRLRSIERYSRCRMDAILSAIWYPVHALFFTPAEDDDDQGVDPIYPLTVFFALGIWFVFKRYQYIRYRAVPFSIAIPEVSLSPQLALETPSESYPAGCITELDINGVTQPILGGPSCRS